MSTRLTHMAILGGKSAWVAIVAASWVSMISQERIYWLLQAFQRGCQKEVQCKIKIIWNHNDIRRHSYRKEMVSDTGQNLFGWFLNKNNRCLSYCGWRFALPWWNPVVKWPWRHLPREECMPHRHGMADRSKLKERVHLNQFMVQLYGWSHFSACREASVL